MYPLPAINANSKYVQFQVPLKPVGGQKKITAKMGNTWHSFFEKKSAVDYNQEGKPSVTREGGGSSYQGLKHATSTGAGSSLRF